MNRYQPPVPRTALALAAFAMTAITIGLLVVLPAELASAPHPLAAQEAVQTVAPTAHGAADAS